MLNFHINLIIANKYLIMNSLELKRRRLDLGLTQAELADKFGVTSRTIINYEKSGELPKSKSELFHRLFSELESVGLNNYENISVGSHEIVKEVDKFENRNGNEFAELPNGQFIMTMPVIEVNAQAGLLDNYQNAEYLMDMEQYGLVVDKPAKGRYIAFRVSGHSMDDGGFNAIPDKSIVSTRELQRQHWSNRIRTNDFPYWVIYTTQSKMPLLKEIIGHNTEEGYITCHSLNDSPEFSDFNLNIDDIQALFYVIDVKKTISKKSTY